MSNAASLEPTQKASQPASSGILASTAILGASSIAVILLGIVRNKIIALLLGPAGIGLIGLYTSISTFMISLAGCGLGNSGVRQVAQAVTSGEEGKLSRAAGGLKWTVLFLGCLGALLLFIFRKPVCQLTFGDLNNVGSIPILAGAVFFGVINVGQTALIQGMRRVVDLAIITILAAAISTAAAIPIIYWLRESGITISLLVTAAGGVGVFWVCSRRIRIPDHTHFYDALSEGRELLRLGVVFLASALLSTGVAYASRLLVNAGFGVDGVGMFQAASALSSIYVSFILQAMGTDFYPHLSQSADSDSKCNSLVNDQITVSYLLALPGILATLALAPVVIQLFYSSQFGPAVEILRWQTLGILLRVLSWPIGYILPAKGMGRAFFITELTAHGSHLLLIWLGVRYVGLHGTGMALAGMYLFYSIMMTIVANRLTGFQWSAFNKKMIIYSVGAVAVVFVAPLWLPRFWAVCFGSLVSLCAGLVCLRCLPPLSCSELKERFEQALAKISALYRMFLNWGRCLRP